MSTLAGSLSVCRAILVALLFALFPRLFLVELMRVPSSSMTPTLAAGDVVLIDRFGFAGGLDPAPRWLPMRKPLHGEVILFRSPLGSHETFVKRIVASAGEVVDLVDKQLLIDGVAQQLPAAHHVDPLVYPDAAFVPDSRRARDQHGPVKIPPGCYFVLGDNRDESWDSRFWGPLPGGAVQGRPLAVLWHRKQDSDTPTARLLGVPRLVR